EVLERARVVEGPDRLRASGREDRRQALVRVHERDAELRRLVEHPRAGVVVEAPAAISVGVALESASLQLLHLMVERLEGRLRSGRSGGVAHHLRDAALGAGELVHEIARLGHAFRTDRIAVWQAAQNADRGLALDEHLLDVLLLSDALRAIDARMQIGTEVEEARLR